MKLISVASKLEGQILPLSWVSLGWMRGSVKGPNCITGAYVSLILPIPIFGSWRDFDSLYTLTGTRMPRVLLGIRRGKVRWYLYRSACLQTISIKEKAANEAA